jgi:hypothetical protein
LVFGKKGKVMIVKKNDEQTIYLNNNHQLHRVDGPAIELSGGTKSWFLNGNYHRVDGPAIEYFNGSKEWYLNGQRHREDGPAIERADGTKSWYLNGQELSEEDFKLKMNAKEYPKKEVKSDGTFWRNEKGEYHREDGPAVELANGNKFWYLNGQYHREDGPAVELANGYKEWWLNGQYHREDGPAVEDGCAVEGLLWRKSPHALLCCLLFSPPLHLDGVFGEDRGAGTINRIYRIRRAERQPPLGVNAPDMAIGARCARDLPPMVDSGFLPLIIATDEHADARTQWQDVMLHAVLDRQ